MKKSNEKNQINEENQVLENRIQDENTHKNGILGKIFSKPTMYVACGLVFLKALVGIGDIKTAEAGFYDEVSNGVHSQLNFTEENESNLVLDTNTQYFFEKSLADKKGMTGHVDLTYTGVLDKDDKTAFNIIAEMNYQFEKKEAPHNWMAGVKANFKVGDNVKVAGALGFEQNNPGNSYVDIINTIIGQVMIAYEDIKFNDDLINFASLGATGKWNLIDKSSFENSLDLQVQAYVEKIFPNDITTFAKLSSEIMNSQEYLISDAVSKTKAEFEAGINLMLSKNFGIKISGTYEWLWKENDKNKINEEQNSGFDLRLHAYPTDWLGIELNYNFNSNGLQSLGLNFTINFNGNISERNNKNWRELDYTNGNGINDYE